MHPFYQVLDPYLIWFYRLSGHAAVDFALGTLALAVICLLIGEVTISLTYGFMRKPLGEKTAEAQIYQDLSMEALKAGDKEAYTAANKLANDAFGHTFFHQAALSAAFLWPIFFALAWMQYRFLDLEFPLVLVPFSLGYIGVFVVIYVPAYFLFKRIKKRLAFFNKPKTLTDSGAAPSMQPQEPATLPIPIHTSDHH